MDDNKHSDQFSASLPLPGDEDNQAPGSGPAAELIRKKVEAAYAHEPDAEEEVEEVEELKPRSRRSKHQDFIYGLTNSGRPLHEIQAAWHEYYAGLTDTDKHQVWQEFYNSQAQAAHHPALSHAEPRPEPAKNIRRKVQSKVEHTKARVPKRPERPAHTAAHHVKTAKKTSPLHSLLFGVGIGGLTIIIFLFGFFNERIIAPFIQPSRTLTNIPSIITNQGAGNLTAGADPEIIIPKINVEVPVIYGVTSTDDATVQDALKQGVVHYADTAQPGQDGNLVIVGHSSGNIFNSGHYKYVFSLLHKLSTGDTFYLQKDSKLYAYQIYDKEVVKPTDVGVLAPSPDNPAVATLITCDPPGVSSNRLVVVGKQISPDPVANSQAGTAGQVAAAKTTLIPSDSPTLWSRLVDWFKH